MERRSAGLAAAALLLGLTLPFLGSALRIDDPLYVALARQWLAAPFDPLGGSSFWHERPARLFDDLYNPPLAALTLVPALAAFGAGAPEWSLQLPSVLLAGFGLVLAARLARELSLPGRLALLVAASPALATSALTAATDAAYFALSTCLWLFAARGRAAEAGWLAGLSAVTRYLGLLNLVPGLLLLRRRALFVALAVLPPAAWAAWTFATYGQAHVLAAGRLQRFEWPRQAEYLAAFVSTLGIAGIPAALALLRRRCLGAFVLGGLAGAAVEAARGHAWPGGPIGFLAFGSGWALLTAAWRAGRQGAETWLAAAFWCHAAWSVLFVYFGAARYALPLLVPLALLLARGGELQWAVRWRFGLGVTAGSALAFTVVAADCGQADAWREAARRLPPAERGFQTGRWGFSHYAERQGYRTLAPREPLRAGDVVAMPVGIHVEDPVPAQAALLEESAWLRVPGPALRLVDRAVDAGFHSSYWGLLPFGLRPGHEETIRLAHPVEWLLRANERARPASVRVALGTPEARFVLLDGWSGDEEFSEDGRRRTFVWSLGEDAALRLALPAGAERLALRASPAAGAVGLLEIAIGDGARARVRLEPGWRSYETRIEGRVAGGPTTLVLRPSGYARPGRIGGEARRLALAVSALAFDAAVEGGNLGVWPARGPDGRPALLVARDGAASYEGSGTR